jgi:hypothetical protein
LNRNELVAVIDGVSAITITAPTVFLATTVHWI